MEDDIIEEDFEDDFEDDDGDASMSLSGGGGGGGERDTGPPLHHGGRSPMGLGDRPPPRQRQRLSPLDTSLASSMDEAISPARLSAELKGFDVAESIELPPGSHK